MGKNNTSNNYTEFFYKAFRNILLVSIPLVIISALILGFTTPHSSASTDQIEFSLSVSCTMSSVVNSAHTKEITNGTYHSNVGKTTITALCNDGNGYTVYATGYGNNEEGNNKLINTTNSQYSIDTGLATSGLASQWAMKLNNIPDDPSSTPPIIESAYDDTYGLVPNNWTKVASRPSGTTDMNLGSSFTTTYSIYTSSSQFAGTYRGQVKYALLHPYSNSNTLSFDNFDQAFAFYEKEKVTVTDPITGNTGSYYKMQDMGSGICDNVSSADESTATQLVDIRDNKLYWVAKLQDGHCWMTQNLDFDIDATKTYTHNDTDLGWDTANFDANATWTPDATNGKYNLPVNGTSVPNWSNQNNYPYSADPGDVYYYTSNSTSDDIKYTSLSNCTSAGHTAGECKHYHTGNYYNWTAAIASNNSSSLTTQYSNAPNSICPAGWRLPIATNVDQSTYEFGELLYKQGITTQRVAEPAHYTTNGFNNTRKSPLWLVRSGTIYDNALTVQAVDGYYLSSSIVDNSKIYAFRFSMDYSYPARSYSRYVGRSVRCIAR